jgi:hypothetical protein
MSTLYIIGNGFDLYHKIDTNYSSFGLFLQRKYPEFYFQITKYLFLPELDEYYKESLTSPLWSDFESSFTRLDLQELLDEFSDYSASPSDKNFTDGEWNAYAYEIKKIVELLTDKLLGFFKEFINNIEFPESSSPNHLKIDHKAKFISFNYTDTLERFYNIKRGRILYIHGKAEQNGSDLILGHGINPLDLEDKRFNPPDNLKPKEVEIWKQFNLPEYDHSYILGVEEANSYFSRSFKDCNRIIRDNKVFFDSLSEIFTIYILGHSLSSVDIQYFNKVASSVNLDSVSWKVSYYSDDQIATHIKTIINLGVKENLIDLIKLESLKSHT